MDEQRHLRANYDIKQKLFRICSNTNELWWKEAHVKSTVIPSNPPYLESGLY